MSAQTAAPAMLNVNGIEVIYNHVILVLKGVSLNVPEGSIVALLGANGAGKTTTLRAISNLLKGERGEVTKGYIEYLGERIEGLTPSDLVKRGVVQVMEGRHCFAHLTVEENLLTGAYTRSGAETRDGLERVYTYFPRLKERRGSLAGYTSGGEQQMTAIGRALMARPKMILLDEPSMGLAPQLVEEIFHIVRELNQKERVSFLLAEQNTSIALRYANHGYILENGRVVMEGEAKSLAENEDVKEFYLGFSSGERKSFRDVKSYRRRKRWLWPAMAAHFDSLETRAPEAREAALMQALPAQVAHAQANAPGFAKILAGVEPAAVRSREALARLPVTRKSELGALQKALPPLGGLNATPVGKLARLFVSPGPVYDPEGRATDWWRTARALFAGGFRDTDLVANTFSHHFTPAASIYETGLRAIGCTVVPTGVGQTEMQVSTIRDLGVSGYVGTPSFLKLIVEKAAEMKADLSCLKRAQVGAEYLPPALREAMRARGIAVTQGYGTADLGSIAYESLLEDGTVAEGMILDEGLILEIVRPGTGDPVGEGEVGEVVITTFNTDYPLIRFATGDLSAVLPGTSPCGRTNVRIRGWMGRADQTTKVRAMFVTPKQVNEIVRRHAEVAKARLVVEGETGNERMTLRCETAARPAGLAEAIVGSIREVTKLRGEVALVDPGSLPNDGKVIEDLRKYD